MKENAAENRRWRYAGSAIKALKEEMPYFVTSDKSIQSKLRHLRGTKNQVHFSGIAIKLEGSCDKRDK